MNRRQLVGSTALAGGLAALGLSPVAWAQGLDTVKVMVGFAAGGTADAMGRRVAEGMRGSYAKSLLVENRTGAGGQIAIQALRGAPTDGSVLLMTPASMLVIYPHIYKKLPYDPVKDLVPAGLGATFEFGLAVGPAVPATVRSVPEFLAWAKANPSGANFGSPASGSSPHFIGELLSRAGKAELRHAPYRGTQPAVLDMIGGQISAVSGPVGDFLPHLAGGKLRILGTSGAKRSRFTPSVLTYAEQGLKDIVFDEWYGFFLPAGSSAEVAQGLNTQLRAALAKQEVVDGLATMGLEARASSTTELAELLKRDLARWAPIVKEIGFTAES